ncbi:MAG TPA: PBP1A family penicillin-binding protein [Clostridia bacterium]|nr:PBP1A family penicillin-binding protein [Clostridia bacterium]
MAPLSTEPPPSGVGEQKFATPPSPTTKAPRLVGWLLYGLLLVATCLVGALAGLLFVYSTDLPQVGELERYRPSSITELYDNEGRVVGSFALQRRVIATYDDYPKVLREAIISIEDKDFEKHWGINFWRIAGAAYRDIMSASRAQGASTLTMQLSRNLFLTPDRKFSRKIQEAMLAMQIERRFTKQQIFTLYANQIFLGHGAYGFEAGSQFYFNKHAKDLTLEEAALLAGLPKAPNSYSPILNPDRALKRRNLIINSMMEDGKITVQEAQRAKATPIKLSPQSDPNSLAPYYVEEIRRYLEKKYGTDQVHEGGLRVYTTLNVDMQRAANQAVLDGLSAYERRHGWKGRLNNVIAAGGVLDQFDHADWRQPVVPGSYVHALVTAVTRTSATLKFGRFDSVIGPAEMAWTTHKFADEILSVGDIAYVKVQSVSGDHAKVSLEQDSGAQGALIAIDNATGEVRAMVGGRDFDESKFNRATQALRQTGSSFKPYVYAAAVDQGAMPDDIILDAPTTFMTASGAYSPHNYDGKYEGNITLRRALAQSRNIPALKLAQRLGIRTVIEYVHKFGVTSEIPAYLPVALGSAEVTLLEQTAAFSTFPNDGVRVAPHFIKKVVDYDGHVLEDNYPDVKDVLSARSARIVTTMLRDAVLHGTGYSATKLKHPLAGKTGTTNDFTDAWFVGFSPSTTCGVWVGFDEKKSLGNKETGGMAALPIWIDLMKVAIAGHEQEQFPELAPEELKKPAVGKVDTADYRPGDGEAH